MQWSMLKKAGRTWHRPPADTMSGIASWSSSLSISGQGPSLTCLGDRRRSTRSNAFSKSFISTLILKMFQCHSIYYLFTTHIMIIHLLQALQ